MNDTRDLLARLERQIDRMTRRPTEGMYGAKQDAFDLALFRDAHAALEKLEAEVQARRDDMRQVTEAFVRRIERLETERDRAFADLDEADELWLKRRATDMAERNKAFDALLEERDRLTAQLDLLRGELKAAEDGSGITNVAAQCAARERVLEAEIARLTALQEHVAAVLRDRADDLTKAACDECEQCGKLVMCSYHSLLSELAKHCGTSAGEVIRRLTAQLAEKERELARLRRELDGEPAQDGEPRVIGLRESLARAEAERDTLRQELAHWKKVAGANSCAEDDALAKLEQLREAATEAMARLRDKDAGGWTRATAGAVNVLEAALLTAPKEASHAD